MVSVDLQDVVAELIVSAKAVVDREVAGMEAAALQLEKPERERATNRWPEGMRWRALADDDFVRLKAALDVLESGTVSVDGDGRKVWSASRKEL